MSILYTVLLLLRLHKLSSPVFAKILKDFKWALPERDRIQNAVAKNKVMNGMPIYHLFPLGIGDLPSVSSFLHTPSLVNYKLIKSTMEIMHP